MKREEKKNRAVLLRWKDRLGIDRAEQGRGG